MWRKKPSDAPQFVFTCHMPWGHFSASQAERRLGGIPEPVSKGMKRPIPEFGTNIFLLRASLVQRRAAPVCSGKRAGTEEAVPPPLNGLDERAAAR